MSIQLWSFPSKDLPEPPPVLTPLRREQPSPFPWTNYKPPQPEERVEESGVKGQIRWVLALPALLIMLLVAGLASFLLVYITVLFRVRDSSTTAFRVEEQGHLFGLTISTFITYIVSLSSPFLILIAAFCISGTWLSSQEQGGRPTVLQYGLMMNLVSSPGIRSIQRAAKYLVQRKRRVYAPPLVHIAFSWVAGIIGLVFLISVVDFWLHAASSVVSSPVLLDGSMEWMSSNANESNFILILPNTSSQRTHAATYSLLRLVPSGEHVAVTLAPISLVKSPNSLVEALSSQSLLTSHYPRTPFLLYICLLYLYSSLAGVIYIWVLWIRTPLILADDGGYPTALELTQRHLTDPLTLVAGLFPCRPLRFTDANPLHSLAENLVTPRLEIGLDTPQRVFRLYRQVSPWMRDDQ
ncbi:hypothetical protein C8J56DRAFT_1164087 [Mycena floridula]|nr:hypothetical protein C8J56DRAFT_1164087 [Mycena floridula]